MPIRPRRRTTTRPRRSSTTPCWPTAPRCSPNWPCAVLGRRRRPAPPPRYRSEASYVGLLGPDRLGGLAEGGELGLGQVPLDDLAHAGPPDLGLDAQVHAGDAV